MNTYKKALIYSLVVGIVEVIVSLIMPIASDGWGGLIQGLMIICAIIGLSIALAITGFVTNTEKRFIKSLAWFGISFVVLIILNIAVAPIRQAQWKAANPPSQNYNPCESDYVGDPNYTCAEYTKNYQPPQRKIP